MRKAPAVRYHPADGSTYLSAQLPVSVADAERGLRASATRQTYGGSNGVGKVLVPERGRFSLEDQTSVRERAVAGHRDDAGATGPAYRRLMQRPLDAGERQYGLRPEVTTKTGSTELAYWQTGSYTMNGKPATMSSDFVLSLRPMGPWKTELNVYQHRVRIFTGREVRMNAHALMPYIDCREQSEDRAVPEDLEVVMQWARTAIYAAPPAGAK